MQSDMYVCLDTLILNRIWMHSAWSGSGRTVMMGFIVFTAVGFKLPKEQQINAGVPSLKLAQPIRGPCLSK